MSYRFLSPALTQMAEAGEFYEGRVLGLGEDLIDEVDEAISRILRFPEAWGRISKGYRHCVLRRFPYSVIYSIEENGIVTVSVFHHSRAPMIWEENF